MSKVQAPELKKYMDKLLFIKLQGNRTVSGYLRGFDIFLNLVLDEVREEGSADKVECGTVVIRGNSVTTMELMATR
ncbi:mRNA splicing protein SMX2 [Sporobolomyces salmoneus]|uniref:mRNA splicing protein SMX2 n=1 Tax=Sporobolomyces salmoneus TaxID=183962 RepID=UPI003171647C